MPCAQSYWKNLTTGGFVALCLVLASSTHAAREVPADAPRITSLHGEEDNPAHDIQPMEELPAHVEAEDGRLTAFADYENAEPGSPNNYWADDKACVPIYLVNRTGKHFDISMEDACSYFMLEVRVDGEWVRAEPHVFSGCGNSYYAYRLGPDEFVRVASFISTQGEAAQGRFRRVYDADEPVATNTGPVHYRPEDIRDAHHDSLWLATADAPTLAQVIQGQVEYNTNERYETIAMGLNAAIRRLGEIGGADQASVLLGVAMENRLGQADSALYALGELGNKAQAYLPVLEAWRTLLERV